MSVQGQSRLGRASRKSDHVGYLNYGPSYFGKARAWVVGKFANDRAFATPMWRADD
jgi:hypothetical protein